MTVDIIAFLCACLDFEVLFEFYIFSLSCIFSQSFVFLNVHLTLYRICCCLINVLHVICIADEHKPLFLQYVRVVLLQS